MQGAIGATRRVFALIETQPNIQDNGSSTAPIQGNFRLDSVYLQYGDATGYALHDVTLDFTAGEVTALVRLPLVPRI